MFGTLRIFHAYLCCCCAKTYSYILLLSSLSVQASRRLKKYWFHWEGITFQDDMLKNQQTTTDVRLRKRVCLKCFDLYWHNDWALLAWRFNDVCNSWSKHVAILSDDFLEDLRFFFEWKVIAVFGALCWAAEALASRKWPKVPRIKDGWNHN